MNSVRIRLIDTGEIIDHGQFNLQKLPHDIKSLSAAAFRCKINQVCLYAVQFDVFDFPFEWHRMCE